MINTALGITSLSDGELLVEVVRLAAIERSATADVIAAIAEVDTRRLYLGQGCSSLFVYCTRILHLSESGAYKRIEAARAARKFPALLGLLNEGAITLTTICLLAPHLNEANNREVFARAMHRSKREVEEIVASLRPQPDAPPMLRKSPADPASPPTKHAMTPLLSNAGEPVVAERATPLPVIERPTSQLVRAVVRATAPARFKLQVTIGAETREKLRRAQDLMRHSVPAGDVSVILDRALDLLLEDLERRKIAMTTRPRHTEGRSSSRHIPARVRREVWARDHGACAFIGDRGRCGETAFLEFHHVKPFAEGGAATIDNIQLRCRAHNQYEADLAFGRTFVLRELPLRYGCSRIFSCRHGRPPQHVLAIDGGGATTENSSSLRREFVVSLLRLRLRKRRRRQLQIRAARRSGPGRRRRPQGAKRLDAAEHGDTIFRSSARGRAWSVPTLCEAPLAR
jgi:hypothetical protein